jgi:poly(3-hydroxybutyrate) depolymerase
MQSILIIMFLHGWGAGPAIFMHGKMLDQAQDEGYIVVGPMGYQPNAAFGAPMGGGQKTQPKKAAKLGLNNDELSEKDVKNVLNIIRAEYDIDEGQKYIIGISAGGAGAIHLGVKYVDDWAAIAAVAPAAFYLQPAMLEPVKDSLRVLIVQGDADTTVPLRQAHRRVDKMKQLEMTYKYYEIKGGTHGNVLNPAVPYIFAFFKEHTKSSPE